MKSVLLSVRPKWCELIANGKKTIEIRKTKPKLNTPFKCYIYCTKPSKKYQTVAGSMVLNDDELFKLPNGEIKYGNSIELIAYDNYSKDNFLNGKIIGEFVCDRIDTIRKRGIDDNFDYCYLSLDKWGNDDIEPEITAVKNSCVLRDDLNDYGENSRMFYGWHISNLVIYDEPKELSEFYKKDFEEALCYWEYLFSIDCVDDEPEPKEEDYILTKSTAELVLRNKGELK